MKPQDDIQEDNEKAKHSAEQSHIKTVQGEDNGISFSEIALTVEEVKLMVESKTCRICLSGESHPEDPLINTLCKCVETVNAIHVKYLQHWTQSKVKIRRRRLVTSYYWKPFHCEVWKTKCPDIIQLPDGSQLQKDSLQKAMVSS
jgi:hypothetical protein